MSELLISGPPGVGKSTVARHLAERTGWELLDLDEEVARRAGMPVADLLAQAGEPALRARELETLLTLPRGRRVLALGGGTLETGPLRRAVRRRGPVVGLTARPETLRQRLQASGAPRPLLAREPVEALVDRRRRRYAAVDRVVSGEGSAEVVAGRVVESTRGLSVLEAALGERRTRVIVGRGLAAAIAGAVASAAPERPVFALVDRGVPASFVDPALSAVDAPHGLVVERLPGGEEAKRLETLPALLERALAAGCGRQSVVLGLGGGAVLDVAALVASLLGRGAGLVLVPTTLLSQVDASVGGKCAMNAGAGRNLVGTVYPADDVVVDLEALDTLPDAERRSGWAELLKIALVSDRALFERLAPYPALEAAHVLRAIEAKLALAGKDPWDHGDRRVLNFGHTLAHALEAASGYALRHGEAVAIGMAAVSRLSAARGWCSVDTKDAILAALAKAGLPVHAPPELLAGAAAFMGSDKKAGAGGAELIIVPEIGQATRKGVSWHEVEDLVRSGGEG